MAVLPRNEALADAILMVLESGRWMTSPQIAAEIGSYDAVRVWACAGEHDREEYHDSHGRLCWRQLTCEPTGRRASGGKALYEHVIRHTVTSQETNPQLMRLRRAGRVRRRDVRGAVEWHKDGRRRTIKVETLEQMLALPDAKVDR